MKINKLKVFLALLILITLISATFSLAYTARYDRKDRAKVGMDLFWKFLSEFVIEWGWLLLLMLIFSSIIIWVMRGGRGNGGGNVQYVPMPQQGFMPGYRPPGF